MKLIKILIYWCYITCKYEYQDDLKITNAKKIYSKIEIICSLNKLNSQVRCRVDEMKKIQDKGDAKIVSTKSIKKVNSK